MQFGGKKVLFRSKKVKEMENIYKLIAKKNHTTPRAVKKEIRTMIKGVWKNTPKESAQKQYQEAVFSKDMIPTGDELILHILSRLISE